MPTDWTATGDFSAVVDALEPVTLRRRGSSEEIAIAKAWRYAARTAESEPAGGYVTASDTEWQLEWDAETPLPQVGDRIVDAMGECWTLLAVEQKQGGTRVHLHSRSLRIAHGLDGLVAIEEAVWEDLGAGPEITGWTTWLPTVHARIQPAVTTVDEATDPISSVATYRITLDTDALLDHNHRIVSGDGTVYRLLTFENAERIDALPVATVRRE